MTGELHFLRYTLQRKHCSGRARFQKNDLCPSDAIALYSYSLICCLHSLLTMSQNVRFRLNAFPPKCHRYLFSAMDTRSAHWVIRLKGFLCSPPENAYFRGSQFECFLKNSKRAFPTFHYQKYFSLILLKLDMGITFSSLPTFCSGNNVLHSFRCRVIRDWKLLYVDIINAPIPFSIKLRPDYFDRHFIGILPY